MHIVGSGKYRDMGTLCSLLPLPGRLEGAVMTFPLLLDQLGAREVLVPITVSRTHKAANRW